jgi:hypothetical protein
VFPLCRWPFPRLCGFPTTGFAGCRSASRRILSSIFSFPEYYPTQPSRPAAADRLLSWALFPYSTVPDRRSTHRGFYLPATFRLQGLVTLWAAYSRRSLAGFFSHRQRSWDSPFEAFSSRKASMCITTWKNPPTVPPADHHIAETMGRHSRPQFLGLNLPRVPGDRWCV